MSNKELSHTGAPAGREKSRNIAAPIPKIVAIVAGTRPEVIKMAPVYLALQRSHTLRPVFLSSGQHKEMLQQACSVFGIVPDRDLKLMRPQQTLPGLTARVIEGAAQALRETKPAAVLVQGDTTTVLGFSLAAFYERIPVGHVEAGLRTHNLQSPWPEEMNRRLTDPLSEWCFAPTESCKENLLAEGIADTRVHVTGNTVIDALFQVRERLLSNGTARRLSAELGVSEPFARQYLQDHGESLQGNSRLILVTGHRRESFGHGFRNICAAIRSLADRNPDVGIVYPVHLNPNVQEPVRQILANHPRIQLLSPVSYEQFVWLMTQSRFILSDSGGVQEEAPSLGKPVLVMRETTERPEGVLAGSCRLVGTDGEAIVNESELLLRDQDEYARRCVLRNPYGDGHAAERIVAVLGRSLQASLPAKA
jgi:UDP-N-acetylglucosamine 2-epimerase (non-hydrolysing)